MKQQKDTIRQFDLSPLARAGLLLKNMRDQIGQGEHDVSKPHRERHYQFMLATQGKLTLTIDFNLVTVIAPAVLLIAPGQVHQVVMATDLQGWAIGFEPSLMDGEFQQVLTKLFRSSLVIQPPLSLLDQSSSLLQVLEKVQQGPSHAYTGRTLQTLLMALLSMLAGLLTATAVHPKSPERRAVVIEQAFYQLVEQHFIAWKQPAQYADALAITVSHLNDVVKVITGFSPSTLIQDRSILEAKRLLYYTQLSVKEIGYQLGYEEPVYFNKLFRKLTGQTPLSFRQQVRD
ncbi:AraC family transcriptional regulator [Spirosoma horti]